MISLLVSLLGRLPLLLLQCLGACAGWMVYLLSPRYRGRLNENLALAGYTRTRMRWSAAAAAGQQALEAAWVWAQAPEKILRAVRADNPEVEAELLAHNQPIIFLTPHLGCFEIIAQYYMLRACGQTRPMTALYRIPHQPALHTLLVSARSRHGLMLAPADLGGVRKLMRALKANQVVGILPDQVPSQGDGSWAPFFGRSAYTMNLPAKLALARGALVAFVYAQRLPWGRGFRLRWEPLARPFGADAQANAAALNQQIEALVGQCPEQYLWAYNRYKVPRGAYTDTQATAT